MSDLDPASRAIQHLRAELDLLRARLSAHLRRLQAAGRLPPPTARFPGMAIAPSEIEARLVEAESPDEFLGELQDAAAAEIERCERVCAELRADAALPLNRLRSAFELTDPEMTLLVLSLAAEFEPTMPRLFGLLHDHFERQFATFQILVDILCTPAEATGLRWLLDAESRLLANALIRVESHHDHRSMAHRPLVAEPRVLRYVQGFTGLDGKLGALARLEPGLDVAAQPLVLTSDDDQTLRHLLQQVAAQREQPAALPILYLRGAAGVGKHAWSRAIAHALGLAHLRVDLVALATEHGSLETGLRVALREARLQGALLCLDEWARIIEPPRHDDAPIRHGDEPRLAASRALVRVLADTPFVLTSQATHAPPPSLARPVKTLDVALPDVEASMALWKRYLPRDRPKAPGLTYKRLAQTFRLTPGHVQQAVAEAVAEQAPGEPLRYETLARAVKQQVRHRLGENAKIILADHDWSDLVVTADVALQLRELVGRWQSKSLVFETWGLGKRFATGQGISVLFEGPPGTGKTMAASILARELDLDLYQIDLSRVVNRYVGETEKNLAQIFDEAERSRVMLLFDEADALFSSRTEVKSSNDRYANLEVNYLLQRVDHYTGIAILTTNFPNALDEAFRRRIAMRVTFPKPQVAERQRLWESMLTNPAILAPNLDTRALAREFDLAGGHIKNAVLRAAFIAANRGCRIDQELLHIAARIELKEQGLLVQGSPYDELRARA
ncbi:MAG: ATP-binding protein [Myxococcota bacterium]